MILTVCPAYGREETWRWWGSVAAARGSVRRHLEQAGGMISRGGGGREKGRDSAGGGGDSARRFGAGFHNPIDPHGRCRRRQDLAGIG
jgi:hypothetical protein